MLSPQQLAAGTLLGPYEIVEPIGAGGMGQVYRATDSRLRRTVAVKILPPGRLHDAAIKKRFLQEARAASALNHPNIVTIHDIACHDGIDYLVMEYIAGKPLHKLIPPQGVPVQDALSFAIQISSALAAAHSAGIIHRDIKPANIIITPAAVAKILDFGLARTAEAPVSALTETITEQAPLTSPGVIVGTVAYMSPEQASGREIDHTTDIFSLGVVLHEMLSGRRPFHRNSQVEIMHAIINDPPPSLPDVPPELDDILAKTLAKNTKDRYRHAGDLELDLLRFRRGLESNSLPSMRTSNSVRTANPGVLKRRDVWLIWIAVLALTGMTVLVAAKRLGVRPSQALRFSIVMPATATWSTLHTVSFSRDGKHIAFIAANPQGNDVIWIRSLHSLQTQPIPGTEGAVYPFWSPTNRFIGFFDGVSLKKVDAPLDGRIVAPPQVLSDAPVPRGGSWNQHGSIVFSSNGTIFSVPESGGSKQTILNPSESYRAYYWPEFLMDGQRFLCLTETVNREYAIQVASRDSKRELFKANTNAVLARASDAAFVLFARANTLMAQRFDETNAALEGEAIPIAQGIALDNVGHAAVSASDTGSLAFGTADTPEFWWHDRSGKLLGSIANSRGFNHPALSEDEHSLMADGAGPEGGINDLWLIDLSRGGMSRFTGGPGYKTGPAWHRSTRSIIFLKYPGPVFYRKALEGPEELLFTPPESTGHFAVSPDGALLVHDALGEKTKSDLWFIRLTDRQRMSVPLLQTSFNEDQPQFSPDNNWLAYESDESGRYEAYVQRISNGVLNAADRYQVSRQGGFQPVWRPDGHELFFLSADRKLTVIEVASDGKRLKVGEPKTLFQTNVTGGTRVRNHYLVTRDGQRILISAPREKANLEPITVMINWTAGLPQ